MEEYEKTFSSNSAWKMLEELLPAKTYEKGRLIYRQGDPAECFYYLKSGRIKIYLSSENGAEKILLVLEPGTLFGEASFFDRMPRVSSAKAQENSGVILVTRAELLRIFTLRPDLAMDMLHYLSHKVRLLSAQVDRMAFLRADQRMARILLELGSPEKSGVIHCTHEELGELAGVSRVTSSKVLAQFVKKGWVTTGYREIRILRREPLTLFAYCEEAPLFPF